MSAQNVFPIHILDVEIINRLSENFDLLVVLKEKSGDQ